MHPSRRRLLLGLWTGLVALLLGAPALAEPGKATSDASPVALVQRTVDQALAVLRDPALSGADKRKQRFERVRAIVSEVFDWEDMAKRSLGVHWRDIDDAKRARFVAALQELLADRYMEDVNRFRGDEQVIVSGMHEEEGVVRVDTTIVTHSREKVPISYFMHAEGNTYRIHDFSVEGVSLVNHYRKSFNRFLVNKPFDELLENLERKVAKQQ
jgi:phospholipid transport system substrate-binding protein